MKALILTISIFILSACGADQMNKKIETQAGAASLTSCACTFEYSPVCSAGVTYDNSCIAKCNGVSVYNSGKICAQPPMPPCPDNMGCGQVMPPVQEYDSECQMIEAKARFIKNGECP